MTVCMYYGYGVIDSNSIIKTMADKNENDVMNRITVKENREVTIGMNVINNWRRIDNISLVKG